MSKRPELVNTKKAGGCDLDQPRAVNSNGKVIQTVCLCVCLSVWIFEYVRASKSVRGCLSAFPSPRVGGVSIFLFYKLIKVPTSAGSVSVSVRLSYIPCPGLPQTFFLLCLKYDLFYNFKYA